MQVNPRTSPTKITQVLEAKWREFDSTNPFTKKDDAEDAAKSSESSTGMIRFLVAEVWKQFELLALMLHSCPACVA